MRAGTLDFEELCRACGLSPNRLMAALASLRRDGKVRFKDAPNSSVGLHGLRLTGDDERTDERTDEVSDKGAVKMQRTLFSVAPRPTIESSVVRIPQGSRRPLDATDARTHGTVAEGGPVTRLRAVAPSDPWDGLPAIAELIVREDRRRKALDAAALAEQAGLGDLADQLLAAIPDDGPLEAEVVTLLTRIGAPTG